MSILFYLMAENPNYIIIALRINSVSCFMFFELSSCKVAVRVILTGTITLIIQSKYQF